MRQTNCLVEELFHPHVRAARHMMLRAPPAAVGPPPLARHHLQMCVWRRTDGRRRIKRCSCHLSSNRGARHPRWEWNSHQGARFPVRGRRARVPPSTLADDCRALPVIADAGVKVGTVKDASVNAKHRRRGPVVRGGPRNAPQPSHQSERSQFFHSDTFRD